MVKQGVSGMRQIGCTVMSVLLLLTEGAGALRNVTLVAPIAALAGDTVLLRCQYDLEGAALYSIKWYRADVEFYRYVPREMPPSMVFALPGATVDVSESNEQQVRIRGVQRHLSGEYQCEVTADAPLFHTEIRTTHLTVVEIPQSRPLLEVERVTYGHGAGAGSSNGASSSSSAGAGGSSSAGFGSSSNGSSGAGDVLRANCSVPAAFPPANISWYINDVKIAETRPKTGTQETEWSEQPAFSQLEVTVADSSSYRAGLTHIPTAVGNQQHRQPQTRSHSGEIHRYTMMAPLAGQFNLHCVGTIFDIYARRSNLVVFKEDAPHPASVIGEDSGGPRIFSNVQLHLVAALLFALHL